jgi:uncharacterized protein involved in outer membrane biogenesis
VKKIVTTIIIVVAALVIISLIIVGVYLNRIVEKAITTYGPQMTKTSVTVEGVHLSLFTGSAKVTGLVVGNPKGYQTGQAIALGTVAVGVDPTTIFSDKVVIRSIRIDSPQITFEGGLEGNNLSKISDNINSSGKSSGTLSTNAATQTGTTAQPKAAKKYEVDDLVISGGKVQVMLTGMQTAQTITLPDIHLTDLGKGGDGITASDLTERVWSAVSSETIQTVAKETASNLSKNAPALKEIGKGAGLQISNALKNFLHK